MMLERISIRDFSLLREVDLELGQGLTVMTGESGAGKSLLFDAVAFALGGKPHRSLLAEGAPGCSVELVLSLDAQEAAALGEPWRNGQNTLKRSLSRSGRTQIAVNGVHTTVSAVQQQLEPWFEITGQFESQVLFNPKAHLELLDAFGEAPLATALEHYQGFYRKLQQARERLQALRVSAASRAQEIDFLGFQVQELSTAHIAAGERAEVEQRLRLLQNAGQLISATERAALLLTGGDSEDGAYDLAARAAVQLNMVETLLGGSEQLPEALRDASAMLDGALDTLQDLASRCQDLAGSIQHDPGETALLAERLDEINRLERKYGVPADELAGLLQAKADRLQWLTDPGTGPEELEREVAKLEQQSADAAAKLTVLRKKAGAKLSDAAAQQFKQLDFAHVELRVELTLLAQPGLQGADQLELLITLNPGEPARPLAQVVSGGEASRLLLGIKAALANQLGYCTMLLDEVEAGLGADTAAKVAAVLQNLARNRQVVAITHLPTVAAAAQQHLQVAKYVTKQRTHVAIHRIEQAERISEMVRLLGGGKDDATLALAKKLLRLKKEPPR